MSSTTLAAAGDQALKNRDWSTAISKYSAALAQSTSPLWLLNRSKAYIGLADFPSALADANAAYHAALSRANRKLMADAQYRRAVAFLRLGEHANADCAARWALQLLGTQPVSAPDTETTDVDADGNYVPRKEEVAAAVRELIGGLRSEAMMQVNPARNQLVAIQSFRQQCLGAMEKLPAGDKGWKPTASKVPPKDENKTQAVATPKAEGTQPAAATAKANTMAAKDLRTDFYQSTDKATLSVFVKGVDKSKFSVKFVPCADASTSTTVYLCGLPLGQEDVSVKLALGGPVTIAESSFRVSPVKIELSLKKATASKWPGGLEGKPETASPDNAASTESASVTATPAAPAPAPAAAAPSYPTSSKKGPVNWDKLAGDDNDDDDKDVNKFFKQLYAGSTDDQRRAMMKSFVESNGTSLSTDWASVKDGTVETKAPEGVEVKPWNR
ncbi:hypothetical protein TD95_002649 [Thielaviopsis punctulata]|uniref:SGS domain-containing protein n=1 Tax=Thielaviopsis punctulata TaxID=72032 RepID=A0A0F4Z958_9PEZI|nr:hypothetical protein TD95_002649 [Thielaviopsis punctulata]